MKLVRFDASHFHLLALWFDSESDVVQWGGPALAFPLDDTQLAAMLAEGHGDPPARLCWMSVNGDEMVGHVQLAFDWRNGNALVSRVALAPAARGRGLAAQMLTLVLEQAFRYTEIERAELNVYSFNAPALRTYDRIGMRREGVRRSSTRVGAERWDTVMMAILRDEWTGRPDAP